jgi:hypothetical protein
MPYATSHRPSSSGRPWKIVRAAVEDDAADDARRRFARDD